MVNSLEEKYSIINEYQDTKTRYNSLVGFRRDTLWSECAELTLPYVFQNYSNGTPPETQPTPFNSLGAYAVNALTSKLILALLPDNGAFFRLYPKKKIQMNTDPSILTNMNTQLSMIERDVIEYIAQNGVRVAVVEALKYLIITGNALLYKNTKGAFKVYSPSQYVVNRDNVGNVREIIIKEELSYSTLPIEVKQKLEEEYGEDLEHIETTSLGKDTILQELDLYTRAIRVHENKFIVWQEILGVVVLPPKTYNRNTFPFMALRWTSVANDSYGRGMVEQYIGDLRSLEGLTQTIVEGSAISAQVLFGVRPGSPIKIEDLNNAENGQFVMGDLIRDVTTLQVNKSADLSIAYQNAATIEDRLSRAFLMVTGNIRQSERTTATEVRAVIGELEQALGGVYAVLASDLQEPLVKLLLQDIEPDTIKVADISITTGVSALSRERDFQNLNTMTQVIAQFGPEIIQKYLNLGEYFQQVATSLGLDTTNMVKSEEQVKMEEQQALQQQMAMMQQQEAVKQQMQQPTQQEGM